MLIFVMLLCSITLHTGAQSNTEIKWDDRNVRRSSLKPIPEDWKIYNPSIITSIKVININIETLNNNAFRGFQNVETLELTGSINKIEDKAFDGLINIKTILLYKNGIRDIGLDVFNTRYHLTTLSMNNNNIEKIRISNCILLEKLNLQRNNLTEINDDNFINLPKIKEINLGYNKLYTIKTNTFDCCEALEDLNLGNNEIMNIEPDVFKKLRKLEKLYLRNNYLKKITTNHFSCLTNLRRLDLNNNSIEKIDNIAFYALHKVTHVDVSHNSISFLDQNLLFYMKELIEISFAHNLIMFLPINFFNKTLNLKSFNFNYNLLKDVQISDNLVNLGDIDLHHNEIHSIKWSEAIQTNLIHLDLSDNNLSHFDESFKHLINIHTFSLNNNKIKNFTWCLSGKLTHLDLSQNKIREIALDKLCSFEGNITSGILEEVNLSSNLITSLKIYNIKKYLLQKQPHLKLIDLRNNSLNAETMKNITSYNSRNALKLIIDEQPTGVEPGKNMTHGNDNEPIDRKPDKPSTESDKVKENIIQNNQGDGDKLDRVFNNERNKMQNNITWIAVGCTVLFVIILAAILGTVRTLKRRRRQPKIEPCNHEVFKPTTTIAAKNNSMLLNDYSEPYEVFELNPDYISHEPNHYEIVD